jgi:uncharacterized membrane protein required for colicin V production
MAMWYDLGVALVLVLAAWHGSRKGLVWQLATIGALVLAFGFAGSLSPRVAPLTGLKSPLDRWVALAILYIVFSFGCFLLARGLRSAIEKVKFQDYDSHLGAIFGFVKGAVFCLVATFFAVTLWPQSHPFILGSYSGLAAARLFDEIGPVVPAEYHKHLEASLEALRNPEAHLAEHHGGVGGYGSGEVHDHEHNHDDEAGHDDHDHGPGAPDGDHHHLLLDLLIGLSKEDAKRLHAEIDAALAKASTGDRRRMIEDIETASPETLPDLVTRWNGGGAGESPDPGPEPTQDDPNAPLTEAERTQRAELLFGIARVYTQFPAAQQTIVDEVAGQLVGVPPRVQLKVLADWSADLLEAGSDPDPETSPVTPLDVRIQRQLGAANVSAESLDQALRERLESWR